MSTWALVALAGSLPLAHVSLRMNARSQRIALPVALALALTGLWQLVVESSESPITPTPAEAGAR